MHILLRTDVTCLIRRWHTISALLIWSYLRIVIVSLAWQINSLCLVSPSLICYVWWMQQPAFWLVLGSSTAVWRSWWQSPLAWPLTCLSSSSIIILIHHCLVGTAPRYLAADCVPVSEMAQRCHLHSAARYQLVVPSCRLNSCGLRAFSVLGTLRLDCCVTLATTL